MVRMVRRVLVPMDESSPAAKALDHAVTVHRSAAVTVLHVIDPIEGSYNPGATVPGYSTEWYEAKKRAADDLFAKAEATAADHGVEISTVLEVGRPAHTIVAYATDNDIDQIVLGCHGRSGVARVLLGSVAETVVRRSPVPVTVVR